MNNKKIDALSHGILLLAWLIGLLIIAVNQSEAQSVKIRVIVSEGDYGFNCPEALQYYKMAAYIIESQPGIRIRHKFVCKNLNNDENLNNQLATFYYLAFNRLGNRKLPTKLITQPLFDSGNAYIGGIAFIGLGAGFGWSFVSDSALLTQERQQWPLVVIAHELGHVFGAYHDESEGSIMSTNALYRLYENPNQTLSFTSKSRKQIRREVRFYNQNRLPKRNNKLCIFNDGLS
jgi:hypothetical protein